MRRVVRAALLVAAVSVSMAQTGDVVRVRASICGNKGCTERVRVAFAPARVAVWVYVAQHPDNRAIGYGLVCDGVVIAESRGELQGKGSDAPTLTREYRDVDAGECFASAVLVRADGSRRTARSETLLVQSRQ